MGRGNPSISVYYPVTKDFRKKLYAEIVREYEEAKEKSQIRQERIGRALSALFDSLLFNIYRKYMLYKIEMEKNKKSVEYC